MIDPNNDPELVRWGEKLQRVAVKTMGIVTLAFVLLVGLLLAASVLYLVVLVVNAAEGG